MQRYGYFIILLYLLFVVSGCREKKPALYFGDKIKIIYKPVIVGTRNVFMAGSFNDWKMYDPLFKMKWDSTAKCFLVNLKLKPGLYRFKFIVDGEWLVPDSVKLTEVDPLGGKLGLFRVVEKK